MLIPIVSLDAEGYLRHLTDWSETVASQLAEAEGIAWATVRRAYDDLDIVSIREKKFQGRWFWHTPEQAAEINADEQDRK